MVIPIHVTRLGAVARPLPAEGAPPGAPRLLDVPYIPWFQSEWCWAACCEMVFKYYGIANVEQCEMASYEFGAACCADPSDGLCRRPAWPDNVYDHWGISYTPYEAAFSPQDVQTEIDRRRPIHPYYLWQGGAGHIAVICGYYPNGDLAVNDPWPNIGASRHTFNDVLAGYGFGSWQRTYYNLTR
jgi:hypothetical protein